MMFLPDKFDYKSMEAASPVFAPFIFLTFTVTMGFTLVNFMLSIIIEGFTTVRAELAGKRKCFVIFCQFFCSLGHVC